MTAYTTRDTCRVCGSTKLDLIMSYGNMPLAGGFVCAGDHRVHDVFPLDLMECLDCTLMQTGQDISPELLFSQYLYSSSASPGLVAHFDNLAWRINEMYRVKDRLFVDVGCNDGVLLKRMRKYGAQVVGIDPSDVAVRASNEQEWELFNEFLTPEVAGKVISKYGNAYIVTACNVLAHNPDPHLMVQGIADLIGSNGIAIIEVHYQSNLISQTQFDTVYHEHTCYYSLKSLIKLFRDHNMTVFHAATIPNHGGSIRVFATAMDIHATSYISTLLDSEFALDRRSFEKRSRSIRNHLWDEIVGIRSKDRRCWAYGASGRGTILLNWCQFSQDDIGAVVDRSPLRMHKVVPGIGIPIVNVETFQKCMPDVCLLTAWNYADSIVSQHPDYHGKWLVPLPEVGYV